MATKQPAAKSGGGAFASLGPLTCAALTTATIMYPVDVIRALRMSGSSFGDFVGTHGVKGLFSQVCTGRTMLSSLCQSIGNSNHRLRTIKSCWRGGLADENL